MKTIVVCASAAFYEHVNAVAAELKRQGLKVVVPASATKMQASGNYDVAAHKTWYQRPEDFTTKAALMREHFNEVANGDAVLVVNDKKHDIDGYIGPNVLMEMGLAFYLHKPIIVLNPISTEMPVYEEVIGMGSVMLDGDISKVSG